MGVLNHKHPERTQGSGASDDLLDVEDINPRPRHNDTVLAAVRNGCWGLPEDASQNLGIETFGR